jgi:hypothetical protein
LVESLGLSVELTWGTVAFLVLATGIGWYWQSSSRARDAANLAAMEACQRMQLQFLDGTVAFTHLRWVRDRGQLVLRRTYVFDYTASSMERLQGFVVLLDARVETVGFAQALEPARTVNSDVITTQRSPQPTSEQSPPAANVLRLEEWRKAKRQPD